MTVPADADPSAGLPIRALVRTRDGVSSALLPTRYQFDPADYPTVVWNDDFGTDRLASRDDILPDPDSTDRAGWWGDMDAEELFNGWPIGTKLWLLKRAKIVGAEDPEGLGHLGQRRVGDLEVADGRALAGQVAQ